jgi:hypothetical protein
MDPMGIAGMIFTLILVGMIGGFILLRPVSKQLGLLLESKLQQNRGPDQQTLDKVDTLTDTVRTLEAEVRLLSDRLEFNEKLLGSRERERAALPSDRKA